MGNKNGAFTQEEIDLYTDLTYFSRRQILRCFERFLDLAPDDESKHAIIHDKRNARLSKTDLERFDEIRVNPFRDRILKVFSSDSDCSFTFDDFVDMMSVFSEAAPRSLKAEYAFRIYDFNEDDAIDAFDIEEVVNCITGEQNQLSKEDVELLIKLILSEGDLDKDSKLSFEEFHYTIIKSPDFMHSFRILL